VGKELQNGRLYSLDEAALSLSISIWTLRRHVARQTVRVTRIGRRVLVASEELERIRREGLPSLRAGINRLAGERLTSGGQEHD
jgi:hypothetical protein